MEKYKRYSKSLIRRKCLMLNVFIIEEKRLKIKKFLKSFYEFNQKKSMKYVFKKYENWKE